MEYLKYIKDFDNLAEQNERIYGFKKLFQTDINDYIDYYYSDEMSSLLETQQS